MLVRTHFQMFLSLASTPISLTTNQNDLMDEMTKSSSFE